MPNAKPCLHAQALPTRMAGAKVPICVGLLPMRAEAFAWHRHLYVKHGCLREWPTHFGEDLHSVRPVAYTKANFVPTNWKSNPNNLATQKPNLVFVQHSKYTEGLGKSPKHIRIS